MFYSDNSVKSEFQGDVWKMKADPQYMKHYNNLMILQLLQKEGTFAEQAMARKEIVICERKLTFWERHPNFNKDAVRVLKEEVTRQWKGRLAS